MKKRIIFPATSRVHIARQKLLIEELRKHFIIDVFTPESPQDDLEAYSIFAAVELRNYIKDKTFDLALIRADRLELLLLTGHLAYRGIPVVHIEGGAESGARVIDTRIRDAITMLADVHLVTDEKAARRVRMLGMEQVHNVGSLDVAFAKQVDPGPKPAEPYILFLHHALPGEDSKELYEALSGIGTKIVGVKSNSDYQKSLMQESFSPEEFISLLYHAKAFVSNSSAACKEASILGTPVTLVGSRQDGRLAGRNALRVRHDPEEMMWAVKVQMAHGRYEPDDVYFKKNTEREIVKILKGL